MNFNNFITSLKRENNKSLIEAILKGYNLLFESRESREGGKKLSEYPRYKFSSKVTIFRATPSDTFNTDDYVTLSGKFAVEHAENNHIVNEEQNHVIKAVVHPDLVVDASNTGEYFYKGDPIKGKIVYSSKGYEYEGDIPDVETLNESTQIYQSDAHDTIDKFIEEVGSDTYKSMKKKFKRKYGENRVNYINRLRRKL